MYAYEYPLKDFNDRAFRGKLKQLIGKQDMGILRHYVNGKLVIFFNEPLTNNEKAILDNLIANPPNGVTYVFDFDRDGAINDIKSIGIEPLDISFDDNGYIKDIVFERELTGIEYKQIMNLMNKQYKKLVKK